MLLSLSFQLDLQFGQMTGIGEIPFAQLKDNRIGQVTGFLVRFAFLIIFLHFFEISLHFFEIS